MQRTPCQVPGCGRTKPTHKLASGDTQWVCQRHWSLLPKDRRRVYTRLKRARHPRAVPLWQFLVAEVIERAAGHG